jgi:hypothetical protein
MTDRELLEAAANANWQEDIANEDVSLRYDEREDAILYLHQDNQDHNGYDREFVWDPRNDDGDALRLAAKLNLCIHFESACVRIGPNMNFPDEYYEEGDDKMAVARRAIVRAAASISNSTKEK